MGVGPLKPALARIPVPIVEDRPVLTVLIPVYNEASTIRRVLSAVARLSMRAEIIMIDDGSTDGSMENALDGTPRSVRLLRHAGNRGKGAAIRTGLKAARGAYAVAQDADLETDPRDLPRLLAALARHPGAAVFGTRFSRGRAGGPLLTYVVNRLLTGAVNLLYGSHLTDVACAYKALETGLFRSLGLRSERFELEAEIAARLLARRVRIIEVPVRYRPRGYAEGKKIHPVDGLRILLTLVKIRLTVPLLKPPQN
jgi:glycosyltransferase involved in cell wall biosynthesis